MKRVITDYPEFYWSVVRIALILSVLSTIVGCLMVLTLGFPLWGVLPLPGTILLSTTFFLLGTEKIRRVRASLEAEIARVKEEPDGKIRALGEDFVIVWNILEYGFEDTKQRCKLIPAEDLKLSSTERTRKQAWAVRNELVDLRRNRQDNDRSVPLLAIAIALLKSDKRSGDKAIKMARERIEEALAILQPDVNKRKAALYDAADQVGPGPGTPSA